MIFEEKLKRGMKKELWSEYCGFLDLDIDSYMQIQYRLMEEQIKLWTSSGLGKTLLGGKSVSSVEEFRAVMPLTDYNDYADILLSKRADMLPDEPIIWIQTTWEGGKHPIKVAPYTRGMLDIFRNNVIACMIMSCAEDAPNSTLKAAINAICAGPLPYATGLFPVALDEELYIEFLPPVKEAVNMSFSERNNKGFKLGMNKGIDFFFGLGSVAYYVSTALSSITGGGTSQPDKSQSKSDQMTGVSVSPVAVMRYLRAKYRAARENREILPRDLFKLKGFMVAGTDNICYRDDLEYMWGVRPLELFAGTEPSCIGMETLDAQRIYLSPTPVFTSLYPSRDAEKLSDPSYRPLTCLLNEVRPRKVRACNFGFQGRGVHALPRATCTAASGSKTRRRHEDTALQLHRPHTHGYRYCGIYAYNRKLDK